MKVHRNVLQRVILFLLSLPTSLSFFPHPFFLFAGLSRLQIEFAWRDMGAHWAIKVVGDTWEDRLGSWDWRGCSSGKFRRHSHSTRQPLTGTWNTALPLFKCFGTKVRRLGWWPVLLPNNCVTELTLQTFCLFIYELHLSTQVWQDCCENYMR